MDQTVVIIIIENEANRSKTNMNEAKRRRTKLTEANQAYKKKANSLRHERRMRSAKSNRTHQQHSGYQTTANVESVRDTTNRVLVPFHGLNGTEPV